MILPTLRRLPGALIRRVGVAVIRLIYRIEVVHPERIPRSGGILLLPNHVTFADAFFITAASRRPVRFVMDHVFLSKRTIRGFVSIFQTVTIRRDQPREAIRITIDALKQGDVVCLFPEGQLTRTGTLCELRRGFELIARKAGHPLVPMWCDGSWGSIFSFERGRFFKKSPYQLPYRLTFAFGEEIPPERADLTAVRDGLLVASAAAISKRFESPSWESRLPEAPSRALREFSSLSGRDRRRFWVNGYQIGQIHALARQQPFFVLASDSCMAGLPALALTFPSLFKAKVIAQPETMPGVWCGGDGLRERIENQKNVDGIIFYDFSSRALEPLGRPGLRHFPCLAIAGVVVSMSMPHPPSADNNEPQPGHKPDTWGKLLPGFYLQEHEGLRIHGPAAPDEGVPLPKGTSLDSQGFLSTIP